MAPPFTPVFYKQSKLGNAIWFRRCTYLVLEFSNASFLASSYHIKWQAFSIGSRLGRQPKRKNAVVWSDFGVLSYTGTCRSVANAGFLCFSCKRKAWLLLSPFWKTSEPCEIPRTFSQPYIRDNFQKVILGLKTCMPWQVINAFSVRYIQCHFVQRWKKVLAKLMKTSAHNTMQRWIGGGGEGVSTTCVTGVAGFLKRWLLKISPFSPEWRCSQLVN